MDYLTKIQSYFSRDDINMVYLAIGCAMDTTTYPEYTFMDNFQQYPPCLYKFRQPRKKQLIVLLDPHLEIPTRIIEFFELSGDLLIEDESGTNYSVLSNEHTVVICVTDYFYFSSNKYLSDEENTKANLDCEFLQHIVKNCLTTRKHMIVQDFSGPTDFICTYIDLFLKFDHDELSSYVLFDITKEEGGCFPILTDAQAPIDSDGKFIQNKYKLLIMLMDSPDYGEILSQRINYLINYLIWNYINIKTSKFDKVITSRIISLMFNIYGVGFGFEFELDKTHIDIILSKYYDLIVLVVNDILRSGEHSPEIFDVIMAHIHTLSFCDISHIIKMLKF